jgi:hypothetical protein
VVCQGARAFLIVAKNGQIAEREIRALTGKKRTILG